MLIYAGLRKRAFDFSYNSALCYLAKAIVKFFNKRLRYGKKRRVSEFHRLWMEQQLAEAQKSVSDMRRCINQHPHHASNHATLN